MLRFFNFRVPGQYRLIAAAFLIGCLQTVVAAAPLADYKRRVHQAQIATDQLYEKLAEADAELITGTVTGIERLVPPAESIDTPGGSVETQNAWLRNQLKLFRDTDDESTRGAILTEVSERLRAVHDSIEALEAAVGGEQSKDQNKQKLAEILRREEYQKPQPKEPSQFQKWLDSFLEWLAKTFPRAPSTLGAWSGLGPLQFWLQILIYALVIALVGFLIYKFAPFFARRLGARGSAEKHDRVILGERVGADESAHDLFSEAERLALAGDLRAAIRKGYVALLCDLADRNIVRLARHKTNRDYLRDVRKNQALFEDVNGLTRNFETNWYGLRVPQEADWEQFRSLYRRALGNAG